MTIVEFGRWWAIIAMIEGVRFFVIASAVMLVILVGGRWMRDRKIQKRPVAFADLRREWGAGIVSVLCFAFVAAVTLAAIYAEIIVLRRHELSLVKFVLFQVGMAVAHDTYFYWTHRLLHDRRLFRRVHMTHHLSKAPTAYTGYSFSWAEALVQAGFVPLWMFFVPTGLENVTVFFIHQVICNSIGHSGHELAWPGFTRSWVTGWLATTTHHDLHHSEGRYNYALWFTWWDRMMGTEHPRYHERFEANARPLFGRRPITETSPAGDAG